nr:MULTISPECIES: hypothetical protein [Bacillus]
MAPGGLVSFNALALIGNGITFNGTNAFTLNQPGLYLVIYTVNTAENTGASAFSVAVNGTNAASIGNSATSGGNMGSGTVIRVQGSPVTISLVSASATARDLVLTNGGSCASFQICRFADGPSV